MTNAEKLKDMISEDVLPEIEDCIDEIFELVASKKATEDDTNELKDLQEMQKEFKEMIKDIDSGDMEEEELLEIIEEIEAMQKEE
jgi:L-asparaginase/Glu-tRNA(Gln) amidotransferase subunit D